MKSLILTIGIVLVSAGSARANAELRQAIADFAGDLKKLLDGQGESNVAIGQFSGPSNFPTSGGPGIAHILGEELGKKGVQIKTRAKFGIKGAYRLTEMPAQDPDDARLGRKVLATEIEAQVVDQFDKPLGNISLKRQIKGEQTVFHLTGIPAAMPTHGNQTTERERDDSLRKNLDDPKCDIQGSIIRTKASSPYAVEILVMDHGRAAENKDGLPFVSIKRGEEYAVRLINESPHEAAVALHIDGLSMFAFSELRQPDMVKDDKGMTVENKKKGEPLYTVVILPPKKDGKPGEAIIRGWHVNNKQTDKFLVTEYAKSAAASLNHTANLGTITATFQAAWAKEVGPPADEPGLKRGEGSGDATGRGDRIGQEYKEVIRHFGVIRDCVSVRYTK